MNTFVLEVWDDEREFVSFYTVRWEDAELSEMDKFLVRMETIPAMKQPVQELLYLLLEVIGNTYGADHAFFNRFENQVTALPPQGEVRIDQIVFHYKGMPLRLYCLVLNEGLVILFNGGVKNSRAVQYSHDSITTKFYEANKLAERILKAIYSGEILIDGRTIMDCRGDTDIYI